MIELIIDLLIMLFFDAIKPKETPYKTSVQPDWIILDGFHREYETSFNDSEDCNCEDF